MRHELERSSTWPRIVDLVWVRPDSARAVAVRVGVAVLVALIAHGAIAVGADLVEPPLYTWTAEMIVEVDRRLAHEQHVDVDPPVPPPPPPPEPEVAKAPPPRATPTPAPATPPPPAEAGKIVAAEPDAPADLTGEVFVTGSGDAYAGGVTTSTGTNKQAVPSGPVGPPDAPPGPPRRAGPDRSKPVALADEDWSCPWPRSAEAAEIDEQAVVLRVVVRADGTVETATLVSDPGAGFGSAALDCARRSRFHPALGPDGKPVRATSPPIRVRFTR